MLVSATPCLLKMVRAKTKLPPTKSIHCTLRAPWKNNIVNFERGTPTGAGNYNNQGIQKASN